MDSPSPVIPIFSVADYDRQIRRGADVLRGGGLVVLPTETVYGAAGLLTHPEARRRLHGLRGESNGDSRAESGSKPFTLHLARPDDAARYLGEVGDLGRRMMKKLWPGPVSLIFDVPAERRRQVAAELGVVESDLYDPSGITLRCPDNIVAADVIGSVEGPVALMVPPAAAGHSGSGEQMARDLEGKVDLVFEAGPTTWSKPSTMLKVGEGRYEIVREGVFDARIIEKLLRTTILFVCSGNTCRSPMAEAIARRLLAEKEGVPEPDLERKGISVLSAGAFAMPGSKATPQAVDAVRTLGADLTAHRSRPLTIELIHQADRIYTMSLAHAQAVTAMVPSAREKVATLDPGGDVEDPIGGDIALYEDLAGQLRGLIERRIGEMK